MINTWTTGGPYGGWIEYLALGDEESEIVYVILKNVGLFRSRDGEESWELIFIEIGHENRVTGDPTNPERLYIVKHAAENTGLFRSEDRGDTWTALPHPLPGTDLNGFFAFVNPHNGALLGALFVSPGDQCTWVCGLFQFDQNTQTWIRLEEAGLLDETTPVTSIAFDPQDPDILYAGLVGGQVFKSVDGVRTGSCTANRPSTSSGSWWATRPVESFGVWAPSRWRSKARRFISI